eukprot:COSAG01_NODE_3473_length_6040_cov_7.538630_2_plen_121_part_00
MGLTQPAQKSTYFRKFLGRVVYFDFYKYISRYIIDLDSKVVSVVSILESVRLYRYGSTGTAVQLHSCFLLSLKISREQEISVELISHYRLGVNATFTTSPIVCLYLGICLSPYITPQCLK